MSTPATMVEPRHIRLSGATDALHEHLHTVVASIAPFDSRENYARFVEVQYIFHREVEPLYRRPALQVLLPDLDTRSRRAAAAADLQDLGRSLPSVEAGLAETLSVPQAIGWLFVAEGSTLGAAILLKRVQSLGLSESFGARHMAPHPSGRAKLWKRFVDALDGLQLSEEDDAELIGGARMAFQHFGELLTRERDA
jgi:heme oxygenase (biliverdin-IX-beta and delta-forming)